MRIAMIGTRGVPARYGGFETCVEEVGQRLAAAGHQVTVYCRPVQGGESRPDTFRGMSLVHLPVIRRRSLETLSHTALSVVQPALSGTDAALVFNAANAPLLPAIRLRRIPVATHVDGLEWLRGKWGPAAQNYYRVAEALAVRWSDALIADAHGIQDYYTRVFRAPTDLIAYGAPIFAEARIDRLAELGLQSKRYHLVVARFEPENHVLEVVRGYVQSDARHPLIVVGSAPYGDDYTAQIEAAADHRVRLLGGLWDQDQLNQLYGGALSYLHGHSVGGTNPSLLRAAGAGAYTLAWDVNFNREVLEQTAGYFSNPEELRVLLENVERQPERAEADGRALRESVRRYDWDDVASRYEELCSRLANKRFTKRRPSGKRYCRRPQELAC